MRSTFELHDELLDGQLASRLRDWRAQDPPVSYDAIVDRLREMGVDVSRSTVNRWCNEVAS